MEEQLHELQVFSILDREKISKILNVLDESIVEDPFGSPKRKSIRELGFTDRQSYDILECFFNFYRGLQYPDKIKQFIVHLDVNKDVKQLMTETFEKVIKKGNSTKVIISNKSAILKNFGHNHLHHFNVTPEFRPVVVDGKLEKMVVAIVIDGEAQRAAHTEASPINFQMDLKHFEDLVGDLNKQLEQIKIEVKILKEKLGDNVVGA